MNFKEMEATYILTGTNNRDKNMICSSFTNVKYEVSEIKEIYRNDTTANYYFV